MMRFRCAEDEQRYNELRSQIYVRLATSGMPPRIVSEVLRNFGKLEALLHLEGLRQGVAAQTLYEMSMVLEKPLCPPAKAYQLHSAVYGSSDTPLRAVELEWLERFEQDADVLSESALDPKPMRFAPTTLAEAVAAGRFVHKQEDILESLHVAPEQVRVKPMPESKPVLDVLDEMLGDAPPPMNEEESETQQSPDALERVRSILQILTRGGWRPSDWPSLVMKLHQHLGIDAGFLDLQLSSPMGVTVLAQCGVDVRPGPSVGLHDFSGPLEDVNAGRAGDPEPGA